MGHIETWILILSLLFPRITLLFAYMNHCVPANTIPFWGDFFMCLFIPRILMLIYIGTNIGCGNVWFILHLVFLILVYLRGTVSVASKSKS